MTREIKLHKSTDKIIGSLRCSTRVYNKVSELAKKHRVSLQDVIRAILEDVIDEIEITN